MITNERLSFSSAVKTWYRGPHVWLSLAWFEILIRYRRSTFGPFWITFNTLLFVGGVGTLYAGLLNQPTSIFLHHLAISIIIWQFFSGSITESAESLISSRELLLNTNITAATCILKTIAKNFIIFLHNLVVIILTYAIAFPNVGTDLLLFPFGLVALVANITWISFVVAIVSARYRDVPLIVAAILQLLFILSPVIWTPDMLPANSPFIALNPLTYILGAARSAVLQGGFNVFSFSLSSVFAVIGTSFAIHLYTSTKNRIPYWI